MKLLSLDELARIDLEYPDAPPELESERPANLKTEFPLLGEWELRALYRHRPSLPEEGGEPRWYPYYRFESREERWRFADDNILVKRIRTMPEPQAEPDADPTLPSNPSSRPRSEITTFEHFFWYSAEDQRLYIDLECEEADDDSSWMEAFVVRMLTPRRALVYRLGFFSSCRDSLWAYLIERSR